MGIIPNLSLKKVPQYHALLTTSLTDGAQRFYASSHLSQDLSAILISAWRKEQLRTKLKALKKSMDDMDRNRKAQFVQSVSSCAQLYSICHACVWCVCGVCAVCCVHVMCVYAVMAVWTECVSEALGVRL